MLIEDVIRTLNEMEDSGVLERYAIGGAVAASMYLEPFATLDVDVFISIAGGEGLISLEPIYGYLRQRGCSFEAGHVVISGWPVQFLPPTGPLVEEALLRAVDLPLAEAREHVRVFTAEHLAAIALETGRAKDKARLLQFLESEMLDRERFQEILLRFGLEAKWVKFREQFLEEKG